MFEFSDELNMTLDQVQLFQSYRYVSGKLALCGIASIDLALLTFAKKITTDPVDNDDCKLLTCALTLWSTCGWTMYYSCMVTYTHSSIEPQPHRTVVFTIVRLLDKSLTVVR